MALIPGPPTPMTCRRSGRERSSGGAGGAGTTAVTVAARLGVAGRRRTASERLQRGSRAWRATLSSRPAAVIETNSDDPPAEKNGRVRPVTGISPVTPPRLTTAWTPNHAVMPPASSMPNRSGAASAACIPNHVSSMNPPTTATAPIEPELVGDDGEDEVAVGQREVAELAVAAADAGAGQPAVGDGQEPLVGLVRELVAVPGDVEERREAARTGRRSTRRSRAPRRRPCPPSPASATAGRRR